jgi:di/tricarboxylate transporter
LNIIFFASALSIGPILGHIHLSAQFARLMARWIPSTHLDFPTALELGALVQFLHVPLSTVTSAMATVSPIYEHYAVVQHVSPVVATWIVVASASAYLFPYQNEPLLMAYGEGYWTMWDMVKQGIFVSLVTLLLVPVFTVTWWAWTVH